MRLFKLMSSIMVVTAVALLYVHQQVELVKLSYAIEYKENKLKDILERRGALGYNIDNLEAPSRLEQALFSKNIEVAFPKRNHVVKVASLPYARREGHLNTIGVERKPNILEIFEFLIPKAEAQAREK